MAKLEKTCPSSTNEIGATLLGVVNQDGSVGYFSNPVIIDESFKEIFNETEAPESKFRFSNTCVEKGCKQWQNGACSVIKNVMNLNENANLEVKLPDCSIRPSCRWYFQEGAKACSFCPYIITNMMEEGIKNKVLI